MKKQKRSPGERRWDEADRKQKISLKKRREKRRRIDLYVDAELDSWEADHAYQNRR